MSYTTLKNLALLIPPILCLASAPIKADQNAKDQEIVLAPSIDVDQPVLKFFPLTSAKLSETPNVQAWDFLSLLTSVTITYIMSEVNPLEQRLKQDTELFDLKINRK